MIAKLRIQNIVALIFCLLALCGCGASQDNEELLDAFLAGEIPAYYDDETIIMYDQLPHDENDYLSYYYVGERIDLDNDGENEQIVNGPYGGIYFDARDGKVYVLAEGSGTAMV